MGSPTLIGFPAAPRQPDEAGGGTVAPTGEGLLGVRVVVRTPTVETFIQKYSRFVKDDRIFIFTKTFQPPGTRMRFALELGDGKPLVTGEGTVTRVRPETGDANRPPGMELRFVPSDDASRKLVELMLAERDTRSSTLRPVVVEPRAELPALPLTGAHPSLPASRMLLALAPQRPEVPPPDDAPSAALIPEQARAAALAHSLAPPAAESPPSSVRVTTRAHVVPVAEPASPAFDESWSRPAQAHPSVTTSPSGAHSTLDPDSLFAMPEPHSTPEPQVDEGLPPLPEERTSLTKISDELSQSFPGVAPSFVETWRPLSADPSLVPANPFSELPDDAIEYFVEWSIDRSQGPQPLATPPIAAPAIEAWRLQSQMLPALSLAPERQAQRRGFIVGVCVGLVLGGCAVALALTMRTPAPPPVARAVEAPRAVPPVVPVVALPVAVARRSDVAITSHPVGATCVVDGAPAGRTPVTLPLDNGTHAVVLTMDRYASLETTVVAPGSLDATLKRPEAKLKVTSSPTGGEVKIDGQERGVTPLSVSLSAYENHEVAIAGAGGRSWHRKLYVRAPSMSVAAKLGSAPPLHPKGFR
ncbi:MAG: PEGA domain-containing protein [Polyangia bacterium]